MEKIDVPFSKRIHETKKFIKINKLTDFGRFKERYYTTPNGRVFSTAKWAFLKPSTNNTGGYKRYWLQTRSGDWQWVYAHDLAACMAQGPKPKGMQVRHLDGNATNNDPSNLAYGTIDENAQDRVKHGTAGKKLSKRQKREVKTFANYVDRPWSKNKLSYGRIADKLDVSPASVSKIDKELDDTETTIELLRESDDDVVVIPLRRKEALEA